jgi:N-acetylglucosamine kinase-like BadF-type ATPase
MRSKRLALGVDGGGSKVDAILIDETGKVLGWGRSGSAAGVYVSLQEARKAYDEAIRTALGNHRLQNLWIAGIPKHEFEGVGGLTPDLRYIDASETTRALASAMEVHGLVVLSGTGSFVSGITEKGETVHLDSLGPILGDHGSGYQIGLMGIRAAVAASWSPKRQTVLEQTVPKALGVNSPKEIYDLVYIKDIGRAGIASTAKAVVTAAEEGDAIARKIVLQAADDIADVLEDAIYRLKAQSKNYALVASGGIAQGSRLYWSRVCERALAIAPYLRPVQPKVPPCVGAALLALKAMGIPWSQELLTKIEETMPCEGKMGR